MAAPAQIRKRLLAEWPAGGLQCNTRLQRPWRWTRGNGVQSALVRCKREQWYLLRCWSPAPAEIKPEKLLVLFERNNVPLGRQAVDLRVPTYDETGRQWLGWVRAPKNATHLQLNLPPAMPGNAFQSITLYPVADRDPCGHPLANVPRWSIYQPPFPLERIILPSQLEMLAPEFSGRQVEIATLPRSRGQLLEMVRSAACVLDLNWVIELNLELADLERLAAVSWLIVDLETLAVLVMRATGLPLRLDTPKSPHGIMSARIEYADVATRGFALLDAAPFSAIDAKERFCVRMLRANRSWKRYADETGFATLVSSETPWTADSRQILSAARPVGCGELIATDLPWLVAGLQGPLLAPRVARHLLDMHLGGSIDDGVQYWNRSDEIDVLVRDILDLGKRYPPLGAVRWQSPEAGVARLGLTLPAADAAETPRHWLIQTGRIDDHAIHDGLPAEPMAIFMKWLARERRENTTWAQRFLRNLTVTWQFDSAAGVRYAANYESAAGLEAAGPVTTVMVRANRTNTKSANAPEKTNGGERANMIQIMAEEGIYGDGSLAFQAELSERLRQRIEQQ